MASYTPLSARASPSFPSETQPRLPLEYLVDPLERPPCYQVHDPVWAAMRARAIMTGSSAGEEGWGRRVSVPGRFRGGSAGSAFACASAGMVEGAIEGGRVSGGGSVGGGGGSVGSRGVAEEVLVGRTRVSVVEVGEGSEEEEEGEVAWEEEEGMLARGGRRRFLPPVTEIGRRGRKWSGGISWRKNELVRSAEEVRELECGLEVEGSAQRKRKTSRRATSTVATFGRNVKGKVAGWLKRDSVESTPYWLVADGEAGEEAGFGSLGSSVAENGGAEILATASPSLRYARDDGGPLTLSHANISLVQAPKGEVPASSQPALPEHFLPHLSDRERVTHSQMLEQMEVDLSRAFANGRMDTDEIQRHYFSLVGNRTNTADQTTAAILLRLESRQTRERAEEEYKRAERQRGIAEMAANRRVWNRLFDVQWPEQGGRTSVICRRKMS
ncbi:hypothetical protein LTS16_014003 [Friedmanniomyces endolithicus]|nr:hypothetical protein LTR57_024931 [Friedmanniomyces endolithicus]KAK1036156.1 hypothetical protein LTS16_014003 [Friedmanniomyces endolithicus]